MKLSGKNIIGTEVLRSEESFVATSPLDGTVLDGRFEMAGVADVDTAIRLALVAFESFGKSSGTSRADFWNASLRKLNCSATIFCSGRIWKRAFLWPDSPANVVAP